MTVVLVLLPTDGSDADAFRTAIQESSALHGQVDLRFAVGAAAVTVAVDADIIVCGTLPNEVLSAAVQLRWIHFWSAGLDGKVNEEIRRRGVLVTNASGVHGPNIAEHVLCMLLMFAHQMPYYLRAQQQGIWQRNVNDRTQGPTELTGQTLGIVGLGRIGEALTQRAKAFGMRIVATKRDITARYDAQVQPDQLYGPERLPDLLAESDHICIATPYTPETHHLLSSAQFEKIRSSAYLYNISRGKIIEERALIDALRSGRLAGAGLDVFETEPLAPTSPLWQMENVLITPHIAGNTPFYFQRTASLFAENLLRYLQGERLHNLYQPRLGY